MELFDLGDYVLAVPIRYRDVAPDGRSLMVKRLLGSRLESFERFAPDRVHLVLN